MKKLIVGLAALATLGVSIAYADVIEDREALMKERGRIMGGLSKVAKGETPFDAAAVLTQLQTLQVNADKATAVETLWPAGSQGDSEASPKIWEDAAGFKAESDKFKTVVDAAVATPPVDVAAVGAAMGPIGKECGACHELYRVKK